MIEYGNQWDQIVPMFVWTVRTSTKLYNAKYTPYEMITGMKPRLPLDCLVGNPTIAEQVDPTTYVQQLVAYLKKVHTFVQEERGTSTSS